MTTLTTGRHPDVKMVDPDAAAIDIGATMRMAAANPMVCGVPVRAFGTFARDLHALADCLKECGVASVAMGSTSVHWIPAFGMPEALGFDVILVNARSAGNAPGRKTDVSDAGWPRRVPICAGATA